MWIVNLLTSFGGRINRKSWWIGAVIVTVASIAGTLLLNPGLLDISSPTTPPATLPDMIWSLIWVVPMTAITVKRFNDRNWPNWLGYLLGLLTAAYYVASYFGFMGDPSTFTPLEHALFWPLFGFAMFALVDNGFLPGTPGPNQYGPSPSTTRELTA